VTRRLRRRSRLGTVVQPENWPGLSEGAYGGFCSARGKGTGNHRGDGLSRPWKVIVWNDPINLMSYVAFVFQKLFGYSKEKANKLMMDVHTKGKAVVASGPRERSELDVFRLHEHGLWATMEQDS